MEELVEFLKKNMSIVVDASATPTNYGYEPGHVTVTIYLCGEEICSGYGSF